MKITKIKELLEKGVYTNQEIAEMVDCTDRYVRKVKAKLPFALHCEERGIDIDNVDFYWDKTKEYSIKVKESQEVDIELLHKNIEEALKDVVYTPIFKRETNRPLVLHIADLHFGAYVDSLVKTKPYSIDILAKLLSQTKDIVNSYKSKEVTINIVGDLIESFTGLNHINSWKGLQKGMIGANVVKLCVQVLHEYLLKDIINLKSIKIVAGNHDRLTSNKAEDTDGGVADLIAWGLQMLGYNVEFHPYVISFEVDNVNYVSHHGDKSFSKKKTKEIIWDYGKQGLYNVSISGHLHSFGVRDDSVDHRAIVCPSLFTGNAYSEHLGFTSNSGILITQNNGLGLPNQFNYTL